MSARGGLAEYFRNGFTWFYLALTLILLAVFAHYIVRNLTAPIISGSDTTTHGYQAYYVAHHLHWAPWPKLKLDSNAMFYPYGVDQVFQPWVIERDLFGALCYRLFGLGPWLQVHYLFSIAIVAVAGFFLLRTAHSQVRAAMTALFLAFGNYYAINKFPGHANLTVVHWTTLGVVVDYLLARRFYLTGWLPPRLVALRVVIVLLTIGQDLGYNAGLGLTSFVITAAWIVVLAFVREIAGYLRLRGQSGSTDAGAPATGIRALFDPVAWQKALARPADVGPRTYRLQWITMAVVAAIALFFYFPLVLQIFLHARHFPVTDIQLPGSGASVSAWRILVPIVPSTETGEFQGALIERFKDKPEATFAAQPGLALVLLGVLGLVFAARSRRLGAFVPPLVLLLLVLFYHPDSEHNTLAPFPWLRFARMAGHLGGIFTPTLVLLTLGIPDDSLGSSRRRWVGSARVWLGGAPLAVLLAVEGVTAYRLILSTDWNSPRPDASFYRTMAAVRDSPGQAVLDWPFCIAGGNGFATGELGPYYNKQANIFCLNEFHHKKTVSAYFGRLHPKQYQPLYAAGWPSMFTSDAPPDAILDGSRQSRDFRPYEWRFFEDFFKLNDFCGILLYTDRLQPSTVEGMHARFGEPIAVTQFDKAGRVEFIRRPTAWVKLVNEREGRALKLGGADYTPGKRIDCTQPEGLTYLREGWTSAPPNEPHWSSGHTAEIDFYLQKASNLELRMQASAYHDQHVGIDMNGQVARDGLFVTGSGFKSYRIALPEGSVRAGDNRLVFHLPDAVLPSTLNEGGDPRVLGIIIRWVELAPLSPASGSGDTRPHQ